MATRYFTIRRVPYPGCLEKEGTSTFMTDAHGGSYFAAKLCSTLAAG